MEPYKLFSSSIRSCTALMGSCFGAKGGIGGTLNAWILTGELDLNLRANLVANALAVLLSCSGIFEGTGSFFYTRTGALDVCAKFCGGLSWKVTALMLCLSF